MVISKTAINKRIPRKKDSYIVDTLFLAKNSKKWLGVAQIVSAGRRNYSAVNIRRIEKESSDGDLIVIPGKVLGSGDLTKKLKICALYFSVSALNKIRQNKGEAIKIIDEIKKNPNAEGVKLIR